MLLALGLVLLFYLFFDLVRLGLFYNPVFKSFFFFSVLLVFISHNKNLKKIVKHILSLFHETEKEKKLIEIVSDIPETLEKTKDLS